jgi:hypothetical protein
MNLREAIFRPRLVLALAAGAVFAVAAAPSTATADTTIGADVNQTSSYTGACNGGGNPANQPCTVVDVATTPARTMRSPCDGTVTRFRLNGVPTANTYRVRAVTDNGNGTYTPTATSAPPVTIQSSGVNEFAASMPIKQGQYVGIDFMNDTAAGLRGYSGAGFFEAVFYAFPADGGLGTDTPPPDYDIYLYNADVACSSGQGVQTATKCKKKKKKHREASAAKKKKGCKKKKKK